MSQFHIDAFESSDDEEWTNQLENLIMMEIVQPKQNKNVKKVGINPKSKAIVKQEEDYEEIQPPEEDSDDSDDENLENENDY